MKTVTPFSWQDIIKYTDSTYDQLPAEPGSRCEHSGLHVWNPGIETTRARGSKPRTHRTFPAPGDLCLCGRAAWRKRSTESNWIYDEEGG